MTDEPNWLLPLVLLEHYGGNWEAYLAAIYNYFKSDFIDSKLVYQGRRLGLKRHPLSQGKEATFWHMISEGDTEDNRIPDLRRCERIRWPRSVIEHEANGSVRVWRNRRRGEERICLWLHAHDYLVVLADRKDYLLPWTAYVVDKRHQRQKLQREYEIYRREQAQNG